MRDDAPINIHEYTIPVYATCTSASYTNTGPICVLFHHSGSSRQNFLTYITSANKSIAVKLLLGIYVVVSSM